MTVRQAIAKAEMILPGRPAPEGENDPRWQAIIAIGEFIENEPDAVWTFVKRWGRYRSKDLQAAVATVLLEHLLQHHFEKLFNLVENETTKSKDFAYMFSICSKFRQSCKRKNAVRFDKLKEECKRKQGVRTWRGQLTRQ